jgi:hypothetical protein
MINDYTRQKGLRDRIDRFYEMTFLAERPFISLDLIRMVCGDQLSGGGSRLGGGASRAVYEFDLMPRTVIKITTDPASNMNEWELWKAVKKVPVYAKWFAPCLYISPTGHFLLQKKVRKITKRDKLPKTLPALFTDVKTSNWGFIGKQLVCHDYQHLERAVDTGMNATLKADWDLDSLFE